MTHSEEDFEKRFRKKKLKSITRICKEAYEKKRCTRAKGMRIERMQRMHKQKKVIKMINDGKGQDD